MSIDYAFLHEGVGNKPSHRFELGAFTTWDEVRYDLEKKHGLHEKGSAHRRHGGAGDSYFVGWVYNPKLLHLEQYRSMEPLKSSHLCKSGDALMLARLPMRPGQKAYVPARIRVQQEMLRNSIAENSAFNITPSVPKSSGPIFTDDMTEEEKLKALLDHSDQQSAVSKRAHAGTRHIDRPASHHPSEQTNRAPPPFYVCHRCGGTGHWKQECPSLDNPDYIPVRILRAPTGIPRTFLKKAETEEEKAAAMKTATGDLVIPVQQESPWRDTSRKSVTFAPTEEAHPIDIDEEYE